MNLENLQENQVFKNYKELCEALGEKVYTTTSTKNNQKNNWLRYFDFVERPNRSILIKEIYKEPKPEENNPKGVYVKYIQLILCQMLIKQPDLHIKISKKELFKELGLVNNKYNDYNYETYLLQTLSEDLEKNKKRINNMKSRSSSRLSDIVNSALKSLKNRRIINYIETYVVWDEKGNEQLMDEKMQNLILKTERRTLLEMGYSSITQVCANSKYLDFYNKSQSNFAASEEHEYVGYKKILLISYLKKPVEELIATETIELNKVALNTLTTAAVEKSLNSAKENHLKKIEEEKKAVAIGILYDYQTEEYKMNHVLYEDDYEQINKILLDSLLLYCKKL